MLRNEIYSKFENMSYEKQKEVLKQLDEIKQDDNQAYDDSCNIVEILVDAVVNVVKVIAKNLF